VEGPRPRDPPRRDILLPDPNVPLYVCGETYSHDQGCMEVALDTGAPVVEKLGFDPPSFTP
jgi:hypothetical protein